MQNIIKNILNWFLFLTVVTSLVTIVGILDSWFWHTTTEHKYLAGLVSATIIEIVAVIIAFAKMGLKYLPAVQTDKNTTDTVKFMENFITSGTSASIVSNRLSWLESNSDLISVLKKKIESGISIEIITPNEVSSMLKVELIGAHFYTTGGNAPEARFTLINGNRAGAERLAIARGVHPDHEITIFDNNSGPQIIAMAKDILTKSKRST